MTESYTYTVARIRALEAQMLSSAHVSRMIEAPDLERAFFVLNETSYADHTASAASPFAFEEVFKAETDKVYKFLNYYAGSSPELQLMWRKYDYGNAKILIRAQKLEKEDVGDLLSEYGNVDAGVLKRYIFKGEGSVPEWLAKAINEAVMAFAEEKNPADIDRTLDKIYLNDLRASGNGLLKKLAAAWGEVKHPLDRENEEKTFDILKQIKRHAFGIEPLITFWLAKNYEAKMTYGVLVGKKHYVRTEDLNARGRKTYV